MKVFVIVIQIINVNNHVKIIFVNKKEINVLNIMDMKMVNIFVINQIIFVKVIVQFKDVKRNVNRNKDMMNQNIIV